MTIKIKNKKKADGRVRVRVIRAPLVDNRDLRQVILCRARAIVL